MQDILSNPDSHNLIEESLKQLQETLLKIQETFPTSNVDEIIKSLDVRWNEMKSRSSGLISKVEETGRDFVEYDKKLEDLVIWAEELQNVLDGLGKVDDYVEFQNLVHRFQVRICSHQINVVKVLSVGHGDHGVSVMA